MITNEDVVEIINAISSVDDNYIKMINHAHGSFRYFFYHYIGWQEANNSNDLNKSVISYFKRTTGKRYLDKLPENIKFKILVGML